MAQDDRNRDREKALDMALAQIDKQFGKGSIMRMGEKSTMNIEAIPTGALSLDLALGIGGLPRGRVTEIYGPESSGKSTLAMHVVAEAQRNGGICAYIDAEHALDPVYARAIGVDIDQLLISQPDTGEQALEIADMLMRSGALDVIVIDSVAALTAARRDRGRDGRQPRRPPGPADEPGPAQDHRPTSTRPNTIAIFINQLREKIGVMFGCFSYGTRVTLADGTQEKIGKIVNQKLPVEVLSYDFDADELVAKPVTNWFDNGVAERFLQFTVERSPAATARSQFAATENHLIRTPGGWRAAGELVVGDRVMHGEHRIGSATCSGRSCSAGSWATAHCRRPASGNGARFRMGHGAKQVDYLEWKASLFGNIGLSRPGNDAGAVFVDLHPAARAGRAA